MKKLPENRSPNLTQFLGIIIEDEDSFFNPYFTWNQQKTHFERKEIFIAD